MTHLQGPRAWFACVVWIIIALALTACESDRRVTPASEPDPTPKRQTYVAIGDSYSAGTLIPTTDVAQGCFRSDHNYPALVAKAIRADLDDRTCSGADTSDFSTSQYAEVPAQRTALDERTDVVTVGLGGNDAGVFRTLTSRCPALRASDPTGSPCEASMSSGGKDVLLRQLTATTARLTDVLADIHRRAPNAQVLAVGYPQILEPDQVCAKLPLARGDYGYVARINRALTNSVRKAATATGSTYVDVWGATQGHGICSDDPWINGASDIRGRAPRYHPFAAEHAAVAKEIVSMLGVAQ